MFQNDLQSVPVDSQARVHLYLTLTKQKHTQGLVIYLLLYFSNSQQFKGQLFKEQVKLINNQESKTRHDTLGERANKIKL